MKSTKGVLIVALAFAVVFLQVVETTGQKQYSDADYAGYYAHQYYKEKNYKMAKELYQKALSLDRNNEHAVRGLAQVYEALEDWNLVAVMRKRLAEIKPTDDTNLFLLGDALRRANRYDEAIVAFARADRVKPSAGNHFWIGWIHNERKQYDKAVPAFGEVLRLNPAHTNVRYHLGVSFFHLKLYPKAAEAFQQALRHKVENPEFVYGWLADTHYEQKQFDKAIPFYREAIRLKPDYDYALNRLGVSHFVSKQYPEALIAYQSALRLKPSNAIYWLNVGDTYVKLGRKREAMAVYQKLQGLDAAVAAELLGRINAPTGR